MNNKIQFDEGVYTEKLIFGGPVNEVSIHKIITLFNGIDIYKNTEMFIPIFNEEFCLYTLVNNYEEKSLLK